jgi:hypothetical protein
MCLDRRFNDLILWGALARTTGFELYLGIFAIGTPDVWRHPWVAKAWLRFNVCSIMVSDLS